MDRFWHKVRRGGPDECWPWLGGKARGYGQFGLNGKNVRAHRVAFLLHHGELPEGACILHSCDNPACCNPAHLRAGTHRDNTLDMVAKGRNGKGGPKGALHGRAKLTEEQMREIKSTPRCWGSSAALARRYGVSRAAISYILSGKRWKL
jgi:hypothetical protein